jgi:hypothetical protein
MVDAKGANTL